MRRILCALALLATIVLVASSCGEGSDTSSKDAADDAAATTGRLAHIDGGLKLDGTDLLTVMPTTEGAAAMQMTVGPAVERGTLQSLIASGSKARVFYSGSDKPIAVKVESAPTAGDGAETFDGQVVKVSPTSITIAGDDGERTFAINEADSAAFDIAHLKEHKSEDSAVRIYFRTNGGDHAVAYEDA